MTNWWVLSGLVTELIGAALIARGLSLEKPALWVKGRGTGRWTLEPDADLNYSASSTDAAVGFAVLVLGLLLQGVSAIDSGARGTGWILVVPITAAVLAPILAARWRRHRELAVIGIRIDGFVVHGRMPPGDWQAIIHGYSRALEEIGRGPAAGEHAWAHLDRVYGENQWLPHEALEGMRESFEKNVSITDRDKLGDLWLPWYVRADNSAEPVRDLDRTNARQLRVRDVVDDSVLRPALEEIYEDEGRRWTHLSRIQSYRDQWCMLTSVSQGRFPAFRTADGPVLTDGCHRACAIHALDLPDWRVDLELSDPPANHPDVQSSPREIALGRSGLNGGDHARERAGLAGS